MEQGSSWIAIVDDDPSVLKSLSRALRVHAFECRTYNSGPTFLASLATGVPACLVLDVQMPGMTGLELHHQLLRAGVHIPTIIITAHGDFKMLGASETADIVAVISKPLRNAALFEAIKGALLPQDRAS